MSALASLERFGEENLVFINWRYCRHGLKNKWPLACNLSVWTDKCFFQKLDFFFHEKLKKPSKVAYFSFYWAVSELPKMARSAQTKKGQSKLVVGNFLIRNKLVLKNHFPWPIVNLLHKGKEHLASRNNLRLTKKFLITKFNCKRFIWNVWSTLYVYLCSKCWLLTNILTLSVPLSSNSCCQIWILRVYI